MLKAQPCVHIALNLVSPPPSTVDFLFFMLLFPWRFQLRASVPVCRYLFLFRAIIKQCLLQSGKIYYLTFLSVKNRTNYNLSRVTVCERIHVQFWKEDYRKPLSIFQVGLSSVSSETLLFSVFKSNSFCKPGIHGSSAIFRGDYINVRQIYSILYFKLLSKDIKC